LAQKQRVPPDLTLKNDYLPIYKNLFRHICGSGVYCSSRFGYTVRLALQFYRKCAGGSWTVWIYDCGRL